MIIRSIRQIFSTSFSLNIYVISVYSFEFNNRIAHMPSFMGYRLWLVDDPILRFIGTT